MFLFSKLASKRPYTRSHPNPKPHEIVDDPQRIGKRAKDTSQKSVKWISSSKSEGSNNPLPGAQYVPNKLETLQDINFDLKFEQIMFRSKSKNWADTLVIDQSILHPNSLKSMPSLTRSDQEIVQDFEILEGLVSKFTSAVTYSYLQQLVEFSASNIAASSIASQKIQ